MHFGQTCHAGTRIYVHDDVYGEFVAAYTKQMASLKVGDNFDESVDQGPQNSKMHSKVAEVEGGDGKGYYIQPTIFTNVKPDMEIMREDIFGPVVCIAKFKTEEEVLRDANDTTYGLAAAVHTTDYERVLRITNGVKAGTIWMNMYNFVHWSIPFGGYKQSGIGRECGEAALEKYTETKAVYYNMAIPAPK
ncbi:aldehyde dehydrogenase [Paraphaeosphaeria minitans]|uniref:aldehyde dehydrogenase (NAD(+)) n=1 Tax=Paraphaeosphaeria minitans TaxID=565426 RepID=A0A9P6KN20_9PLEO|nr:aldehyde dehydrogenase [Paraphaeosphaeria minitans]